MIIVTVLEILKNIKKGITKIICCQTTHQDDMLQEVKNKIRVEC